MTNKEKLENIGWKLTLPQMQELKKQIEKKKGGRNGTKENL